MHDDVALRRVLRAGALLLALTCGGPAARAAEETPEPVDEAEAMVEDDGGSEGLVARMGPVTASFRFFGDVGASYDSSNEESEGNFLAGSFDFFTSVRLSDRLQVLSEVVAEFEPDTNEVGFELERLWAQWTKSDAFRLKLGREHSPVNRWNSRYHHGRIFWPAVTQPFLARFEDQGGPLPIHSSGIEVSGTFRRRVGAIGYVAALSNGRGFEPTEVTNVQDHNDGKAWDLGGSFTPSALPGLVFGGNYRSDRIPADPAGPATGDTPEDIISIFGELRAGRWESIAEAASIEHEPPGSASSFEHHSAYLQVNYVRERWSPYARVDVRDMDEGDPFYLGSDLDLDRWDGLIGVRFDLAEQAALKIEAGCGRAEQRDALGEVTTDDVQFASLGLQWVF